MTPQRVPIAGQLGAARASWGHVPRADLPCRRQQAREATAIAHPVADRVACDMKHAPGHLLYPLRLRDGFTGRWYRTRWEAPAEAIPDRGGEVDGPGRWVTPLEAHRDPRVAPQLRPAPGDVVTLTSPVAVDERETMLLSIFLRRYATWCARTERYGAMQGARALYLDLGPSQHIR